MNAEARDAVVTWSSASQAAQIVCGRRNLARTVGVALFVGSVLFAINQLDVVMAGNATTMTWVKSAATFVVPFVVANYGVLTATRRRTKPPAARSTAADDTA